MTRSDQSPDIGYYGNERMEIFSLITPSILSILDVGCGLGNLGARLRSSVDGRKVFGIEHIEEVAKIAKTKLDGVLLGDVQNMDITFDKSMFDCIIFADILEHLLDPVSVLQKLRQFLKSDGIIICSIPNMRHYTVVLKLVRRGWIYEDYGHFDRTHLRFFSLESMKKLIIDSGFVIESIIPRIVASKKMLLMNRMMFGRLEEFIAFHYLMTAKALPLT